MLIQSPGSPVANKENKTLNSADSGKVSQNPHQGRTKTPTGGAA
jgi:hypothetical protein